MTQEEYRAWLAARIVEGTPPEAKAFYSMDKLNEWMKPLGIFVLNMELKLTDTREIQDVNGNKITILGSGYQIILTLELLQRRNHYEPDNDTTLRPGNDTNPEK